MLNTKTMAGQEWMNERSSLYPKPISSEVAGIHSYLKYISCL